MTPKALDDISSRIILRCFKIYSISVCLMDSYFMKSLAAFKEFMTGFKAPNYVRRYCEGLDDFKWQWFYFQMKEPIEFVADVNYLFYVLKWILKSNFDDLGYEVYFQSVMDPEMRPEPLIKDEWWPVLQKRYYERFNSEMAEIDCNSMDKAVAQTIEGRCTHQ